MATKKTAEKSPAKAPSKSAAKSTPAKSAAKKAPAKSTAPEISSSASQARDKKAPSHHEIAELAHKYYSERGHGHHGNHVNDWLRAEKELSK